MEDAGSVVVVDGSRVYSESVHTLSTTISQDQRQTAFHCERTEGEDGEDVEGQWLLYASEIWIPFTYLLDLEARLLRARSVDLHWCVLCHLEVRVG